MAKRVDWERARTSERSVVGGVALWWRRQVWWPLTGLTAILICLSPVWLFWDALSTAQLKGDDFSYLAGCRSGREPFGGLMDPHNAHVVPLFRLVTAGCAHAAGSLTNVSLAFEMATMGALTLLMLAVGHLIAWETRRSGAGLAAMACLGISSVLYPAATWFSAGQTIWSALCAVLCVAFLQAFRLRGGRVWLVAAWMAALSAPFFWTGGVAAGVAGAGYVLGARVARAGRLAILLLAAPCTALAISAPFASAAWREQTDLGDLTAVVRTQRAITHTSQAIVESLIFKNLGVDVLTTPTQGMALCVALAAVWLGTTRRRARRPNALEAAGAGLIVVPYLLALGLRANYEYENLRALGWYDTMPQAGFVLAGFGWLRGALVAEPGRPGGLTRGGAAGVLVLAVAMLVLHTTRVERLLIRAAPNLSEPLRVAFPIPELQRLRALYIRGEEANRQRRALFRLEGVERTAARQGFSREAIRAVVAGPIHLPGWPPQLERSDALDLIALPERGGRAVPANWVVPLREALGLEPEPDYDQTLIRTFRLNAPRS